ncbi:hypothetical protein FACS1894163_05640 [Spirochaetia bacterium]|nr:hypothetical protein FACS1894163_05640 [Spirochaetia bacterium]
MKRLVISLVLCSFAAFMGFAQTDLQPAAIVKLTKSEPITVKQLKTEAEKQVRDILVQNLRRVPTAAEINTAVQNLSASERRQLLDVMINEKLALQAAERDKITVSENEVNQQLQQMRNQMAQSAGRQPTDAEFAAAIRNETGQELAAFRDQIRRQALVQKYLVSKKQNVLFKGRPFITFQPGKFQQVLRNCRVFGGTGIDCAVYFPGIEGLEGQYPPFSA